MQRRAIRLAGRHPRAQPLFRASDRFRFGRWCGSLGDTPPSSDRIAGSKEPRFVLSLGQHDADVAVRSLAPSTTQQFGAKFRGTVILGVQQDQNAPIRSGPTGRKFNGPLQLASLRDLIATDSDRPRTGIA